MIGHEGRTVGAAFEEAAARWPASRCLTAPGPAGPRSLSFAETAAAARRLAAALTEAGYGRGHRVALALGTTPEHYVARLAVNLAGASAVPVNPDYRAAETAYLLDDSGAALILAGPGRRAALEEGVAAAANRPAIVDWDAALAGLPGAPGRAETGAPAPGDEASLLYTSGTTGRPKGCILSHEYELACGDVYRRIGGPLSLGEGGDAVFNPLPSFHINAGVVNFWGCVLSGNELIQPERFSASSWWADIRATGATVFHYLGVVIAVLMADRETARADLGQVRVGVGAGVEPALHVAFEKRFGVPLVEVWGMTEICRVFHMSEAPRLAHTRAFGRPRAGLEARVVDEAGRDVAPGQPGEMVLRHSAETPRRGFFSGYLNRPEATEEAWAGGWFHTGDTVTMDETGLLFFLDRKKNIIRRAGENIAAAEVENLLLDHPAVDQVACVAAPDETREEEVFACVVPAPGHAADRALAERLFAHVHGQLAYYKAPGWVLFVDALPVTGTQKVVKHKLFAAGEDPRERPGAHDLRALKVRT